MSPVAEPSEAVVRNAIARVANRYVDEIRAIIADGSWVRGDFWPGQSDLDLIVVLHSQSRNRSRISSELTELGKTLGLDVEPWLVDEDYLNALRQHRSIDPGFLTSDVQLDVAGFEVVDRHVLLWSPSGMDPLADFPVPRGEHLQHAAMVRIQRLLAETESASWRDEQANRIACDALKAATLFFLLKAGRAPTRDKREIFQLFTDLVPDFSRRRETAQKICQLYRAGDKDGGSQHREACREFVRELVNLIEPSNVYPP